MNGTNGDKEVTDIDETEGAAEIVVLDDESSSSVDIPDIGGDTLTDLSAELKVDELVAMLDASDPDEIAHRREVRNRLEELREKQEEDLDSTFNFNLDDEI